MRNYWPEPTRVVFITPISRSIRPITPIASLDCHPAQSAILAAVRLPQPCIPKAPIFFILLPMETGITASPTASKSTIETWQPTAGRSATRLIRVKR